MFHFSIPKGILRWPAVPMSCCRIRVSFWLAMSAVAASATESTAAVEPAAMPESLMRESPASPAVPIPASVKATPAPVVPIPAAMPAPAAAIPARMTPIPVVPRPHANEYAIHKPLGAVIAVRRASVRVIVIITIGADRRWANINRSVVTRANTHADEHSLRARERRAEQANAKQSCEP